MKKIINTLIFFLAALVIAGYILDKNPENSNNRVVGIYRNIKSEASRLIDAGSEALTDLLISGKFSETIETASKNVLNSVGDLKEIPIIKNSGKTLNITGMPDYKYTANNYEEYCDAIYNSLSSFEESVTIRINNYSEDIYNLDAVNKVMYDNFDIDYGIKTIGATLYSSSRFHAIKINFEYVFDRETMLAMKAASEAKAERIISELIKPGMTDLQKERVLHDYVVNNTSYDYENLTKGTLPEEVYTMYGVLINRKAVCEGYAKAMFKLLSMAGVENKVVIGEADGTPHAWNLVNINGSFTHLDATWDDPVTRTSKGILSYKYFNLSDEQIAKTHTWDNSKYPKGISMPKK